MLVVRSSDTGRGFRGDGGGDPTGSADILYAASDPHGAFIETFGQSTGRTIVTFSVALFDRVAAILRTVDQGGILDYRNVRLLADILDAYQFGLRESG